MSAPFRSILLATEHTEFDVGAERVALAMAARCGLPLAGVIPMPSNPEYEIVAPHLVASLEAEARKKIGAIEEIATAAGVDIDLEVRRGEELWQEIVSEATERGTDLLITRRRGKRGFLAKLMIGDMVSKVAAHAPCHVLMVPRTARMWQRAIVAAVDSSRLAARVAEVATAVAAQCGLPLSFIHVAADEEPADKAPPLADAVARAAAAGVLASAETVRGKIHEAVLDCQKRAGADLLVVGLRSEDAIERFLFGSHARKLIAMADTPVLVVKPRGDEIQ